MEGVGSIRIISSNADDFAAIGRDATRGHVDIVDIQCLSCKFTKEL